MKKFKKIDLIIALTAILGLLLSLGACHEEEVKPKNPGKLATEIPATPNRPENSADHK